MNDLVPFLKDTVSFFRVHFLKIFLLTLPVILPLELVNLGAQDFIGESYGRYFIFLLLGLMCYAIFQGVFINYIASIISGNPKTTTSLYATAFFQWQRLFFISLITMLATAFGLMLFIIPGIIVLLRFSLAEFYGILEGKNLRESIQASIEATKDYQMLLFVGIIIVELIGYLILLVYEYILQSIFGENPLISLSFNVFGHLPSFFAGVFVFRVFNQVTSQNTPPTQE